MEPVQASQLPTEVLAFKLGREEYALDIHKVQELRGYTEATRMADAADYVMGVINLRGVIVPVIDMRILFRIGTPVYDSFTVVMILNVGGRTLGLVVDSVCDVVTLHQEQIRPVPEMSAARCADFMLGIGTLDERMLILLDIERLAADMAPAETLAA